MKERIEAALLAAILVGSMAEAPALAAEKYVYPSKGQSSEQTTKDKSECQSWARSQTGGTTSQTAEASRTKDERTVLKGSARGAAVGAVGGAIAGDAGTGAAAGAAGGALIGGMRHRDQKKQQAQSAASSQDDYDRAYSACLEGRGYTVK